MRKYLKYKDYLAWYEWIEEDKEFHGRILGVEAVIGLYGNTKDELIEDFKIAVKEYEEEFERQNKVPVNEIKEALVV